MRGLKTWAWAVVIASTAAPALAQQTGTTGTGSTGGSTATRTTTTGGTTSSATSSGTTNGSGSNSGSSTQTLQPEAPPVIAAPTGNQTSSLQKSNRFAGYYANPYYQGSVTTANTAPGGFGTALYPATGGTTGTTGRTGATGAAGRGQNSASTQSGILIPLPVQIAYSATMRFPTPPVATPKLQADLRGIIDAGGLANSKTVQVVADANNNVTLRGTVKDDEEARLVEGLVRLTPGVGSITNELAYPVASK